MRWEYRMVMVQGIDLTDLSEAGQQGWEAYAATLVTATLSGDPRHIVWLRRPIAE